MQKTPAAPPPAPQKQTARLDPNDKDAVAKRLEENKKKVAEEKKQAEAKLKAELTDKANAEKKKQEE